MRLKRTILLGIMGSIAIVLCIFWGNFGTWNWRFLFEDPQYVYTEDDLLRDSEVSGLEVKNSIFTAKDNDAWFRIDLKRRSVIQTVEIDILSMNIEQPAQIYYTQYDEFEGNSYKEQVLKVGKNIVDFGDERNVLSLRFDLTQHVGEQFEVETITIKETYTKRLYFWVFTPIILIIYWGFTTIFINRRWIKNRLNNSKWSNKYNTFDQVLSLSMSDFRARFSGSYLGLFWGILQPLSTILLFWFVFQVGFRSQPIDNVPFILWLAAGMIPWNYFNDSWLGGTSAFTGYSYIVKKVVFNVEVLPLVKVLSASILTFIFNGILIVIYTLYGRFPGFHIFDMIYFSFCFGILTLGLSYITASLNVFMKDIGQFLGIAMQFLMWMTPMMWAYTTIPESMSWFYKLNPLHYVINGYRESLINGHWFYYQYKEMVWFWIVAICCLVIGKKLMKRLRPHFADVL